MVVVIVVILFDLSVDGGVIGLVAMVQRLLLRVLLPAEELPDELLVPELSFLNLLNAPMLEVGGLEANIAGDDNCDSGAA